MIALCPIMNIPFKFMGLSSLKLKETDRIEAMKTEMAKLAMYCTTRTIRKLHGMANVAKWQTR